MGNGGHVLDQGDLQAHGLQRTNGGLTAGAGTLYVDLNDLQAIALHSSLSGSLGGGLSGKGGGLTGTTEAQDVYKRQELLVRGDIFLGTLHNQKLLYLDDADVTDFVEKMLTYALIRDVFREMKSGN